MKNFLPIKLKDDFIFRYIGRDPIQIQSRYWLYSGKYLLDVWVKEDKTIYWNVICRKDCYGGNYQATSIKEALFWILNDIQESNHDNRQIEKYNPPD